MSKHKELPESAAKVQSATADLFAKTESGTTGKRDEAKYNARHGKPTTYRLPVELRDRFKEIAEAEKLNLSDLAQYVIKTFVLAYDAGEIELPKQEQVSYTLDID